MPYFPPSSGSNYEILDIQEFNSSSTSTAPAGATHAFLTGWGGGGGGAGYYSTGPCTGGGGGGSELIDTTVPVTALTGYTVTIGAAGVSAVAAADGGDGGDTTFGSLATFPGAQGAKAATSTTTAGGQLYSLGGTSSNRNPSLLACVDAITNGAATSFYSLMVGYRLGCGATVWPNTAQGETNARASRNGFAPGSSGTSTANGGNGGGGPGGVGGNGGIGSSTAPTSPAANSGGGGGGGSNVASGVSAAGALGFLRVIYIKKQ